MINRKVIHRVCSGLFFCRIPETICSISAVEREKRKGVTDIIRNTLEFCGHLREPATR